MTPYVGGFVDRLVYHNFLKGQEVTLPCSYRSKCYVKEGHKKVVEILLKQPGILVNESATLVGVARTALSQALMVSM